MTYLLLQTFLLLLASYFLGAFVACTIKRAVLGARNEEPAGHLAYAPVPAGPMPVDAPQRPPVSLPPQPAARRRAPPVVPRSIDPVQPRIDVLRRPEPRPVPKLVDPSRFERALMGPDPNEGMPRRAIPEICPVVLMPVTGDYQPGSYGPPEPPEPEIPPVPLVEVVEALPIEVERQVLDTETALEDDAARSGEPETINAPPVELTRRSNLSDATTSAAATAVAAAKAAAAASVFPMLRSLVSRTEKARPPEAERPSIENAPEEAEQLRDEPADEIVADETALGVMVANEDAAAARNDDVEDEVIEDARFEDEPIEEDELDDQPFDEEPLEDDELFEEPRVPFPQAEVPQLARTVIEGGDDFQRIRAIGVDLEQRLKSEGVDSFEHIAGWTADDVKRIGQLLGIPGRIDREQWIEQAQILAKGGETYYSRNRLAALKAATPAPETAADQIAERTSSFSQIPDASDELETAAESSEEANFQADSEPDEEVAADPETEAGKEPVADQVGDVVAPDVVTEPDVEVKPSSGNAPSNLSGVLAASHGRSVAEMAAAAAAAIAAASASVTRGLKPIEPISPLSRVDPKISMPAKLSDAIKEKVAASASAQPHEDVEPPRPLAASSHGPQDDLKRIRGVGVLIEKRLNAMGISRYEQIANWTSGEIDRVSQVLEFKGRIEREGWVEQARILLNGGQTEFSRRVDRGEVDTSRET